MRTRSMNVVTLLILILLALLFAACDPATGTPTTNGGGNSTRTAGADELKRWQDTVRKGPGSSSSLPVFSGSGWHSLADGDAVSTDAGGEAELNLAACYPGRIYVFVHSTYNFGAFSCRAGEETSSSCLSGAIYADSCVAEYTVDTGSARITVGGTSFGVAHLAEERELSLVVAMQDTVEVEPWISAQRGLAAPVRVPEAHFLFTVPGARPQPIAGLAPRAAHPVSDLPALLAAVNPQYEEWLMIMAERAREEDRLPPQWPQELGGSGIDTSTPTPEESSGRGLTLEVVMGTGPLSEPGVQQAIVQGVDWRTVLAEAGLDDVRAVATVDNQTVPLQELRLEPKLAAELLDELGYPPRGDDVGFMARFSVELLYPENSEALAIAAEVISAYLFDLNIESGFKPVSIAELDRVLAAQEDSQGGRATGFLTGVLGLRPRR